MKKSWSVSISVKDLVFMVYRGGDLNFQTSTYGRNRAQEGIYLHQILQNNRPEGYEKEYFLKQSFTVGDGDITVQGRADGVMLDESPVIIEEIKSYTGEYELIDHYRKQLHWQQLYVYGYLLLLEQEELNQVELRMTYIQSETEIVTEEIETRDRAFLRNNWDKLFDNFSSYVLDYIDRKEQRNKLLQTQKFPLGEFRPGQRDLSAQVYRAIRDKQKYFIEAPTGTGKTIGHLFPALKAMGEGHLDKVFFLTAKNTGKETARKAFVSMTKENSAIQGLEITSKSKICFNTDLPCDPAECQFANGYFDKVKAAIDEIKNDYQFWSKGEIEEVAAKHKVCPFELSLDLIAESDVVVCDYNYVFDPKVYLRRSFDGENLQTSVLIDEAHNLVSRARNMYSAELREYQLLDSKKKWEKESNRLRKAFVAVAKQFRLLRKLLTEERSEYLETEKPIGLIGSVYQLTKEIDYWVGNNPNHMFRNELLEDYFGLKDFLRISEFYGKNFTTLIEPDGKKITVKLLCMDVAPVLKPTFEKLGSTLFFSATLTPMDFYKTAFFNDQKLEHKQFASPFPVTNAKVVIPTYISTLYKDRKDSLDNLCGAILTLVASKRGNYMVFCPSYSYLNLIVDRLIEFVKGTDLEESILYQEAEMTQEERANFLEQFEDSTANNLIGLVVSGGAFGEGIDLANNRLIGAIVVGVGLPAINYENNAIAAYYKEEFQQGFEFAYQYPGINQVLQNAGRVIRTSTDKGIICLIDTRYINYNYSNHFPQHWDVKYVTNQKELEQVSSSFWSNFSEE